MPGRKYLHAVLLSLALLAVPATAGSIYDSNVEKKLKLTPAQRSKVVAIVRDSDRRMQVVFRKYGIDPYGKPEFIKLVRASVELQAIENRERRAMKKILTPEQMIEYNRLLELTATRVRKAAQ